FHVGRGDVPPSVAEDVLGLHGGGTLQDFVRERKCRCHWQGCRKRTLIREGGFALIHGDPGTGKSVVMRLLEQRLSHIQDRAVASINHPQSNVADFYRELGDLFNIPLRPAQRWNSFKALRERWIDHLTTSRRRSILLVDEAQEMSPSVMSE